MTDFEGLYQKILAVATKNDDFQAFGDLLSCFKNWAKVDNEAPYKHVNEVLGYLEATLRLKIAEQDYKGAEYYRTLIYEVLKFSAPVNFDHYMQALEYDRKPQERFYLPRRKALIGHVKALQDLADDKLDELFLSQPPRTGKTTLNTFFMTWIFGRNSELSNLYVSFSDTLTNSFYQGLLEVINDPVTYHWHDIFTGSRIVQTNAKDETINVNRRKKYPSITCRSLYGTLNGACDCSGFLIADDLLSGIEEAMNPDRLITAWNHVDNNMLTRAKSGAKVLWIGTRWSIADPIGRRLELLQNDAKFKDRRYKIINIPALNESDESNFDYRYGLGFNTDYFHQRRASFEGNNDMASWFAQYQGEPIEREGTLFTADGFKYYNGVLPDKEPDRIFMAVDPAFGGGDYTSAPIVYQFGQEFYVVDVVYDNGEKTITQPLLASKAKKHNVQAMQIEATKATMPFVEGIQKEIEKLEYHLPITTKSAPTNVGKEQRIFDKAPDIRDYFYFLDVSHRTKEYNLFMQNIFSFKIVGKNKHDDAPDSMAMVCDMAFKRQGAKIEIINRPF